MTQIPMNFSSVSIKIHFECALFPCAGL